MKNEIDLAKRYSACLDAYINNPSEAVLERAYQLGREAVSRNLGLLEILEFHQKAAKKNLEKARSHAGLMRIANLAAVVLNETLSPFEMTHRGFQEAHRKLLRMNDELQKDLFRIALLKATCTESASSLSIKQICRHILGVAHERLNLYIGAIYQVDEEKQALKKLASLGEPETELLRAREISINSRSSIGSMVAKMLPMLTHESEAEPQNKDRFKIAGENSRWIVLPITSRDRIVGALAFAFQERRPFTADELSLYESIAEQIGVAIENTRLFKAELSIANTLQKALLTMPSTVPGIEFAHLYQSASEAADVGGDFYDLFEIEHGKIGIVMGDVAGKGLEAATLTALVRNTIKAYAYEDNSPGSIISKLNEAIWRTPESSDYVTVFFGILDCSTESFAYCSGGHPPPLLKKHSGDIGFLEVSSPVVGAFRNVTFNEGRTALNAGDALVLYTDGIVETRKGEDFFGEERLISVVKTETRAQNIPQSIYQEVLRFSNGELTDDIAILAVSPAELPNRLP